MSARHAVAVALLALSAAAAADRPPLPKPAVETVCAGSAPTRACATVDRRAKRTAVTSPAGPWRFDGAPPALVVRADGAAVVEEHRPGGLIERGDAADTVLLVLRTRAGAVNRLTVGDIVRRPTDLPATASHRKWSIVRYFGADGAFLIELTDARCLRLDASGGRRFYARAATPPGLATGCGRPG